MLTRVGGRYVLFYSLGGYGGDGYQTSYASATSLTGPYTKACRSLLTTSTMDTAVRGPGGADVVREAGGDHIVFHGWINGYTARGMYVAALGWVGEYPVVGKPGAVRGRAGHAQPLRRARHRHRVAGSGRGLHRLRRQLGGRHRLRPARGRVLGHIAYAAGFGDAEHPLTVNGGSAQVVSYPNTGWETWRQVRADVTLNAGFNTVRLTHRSRWAELDHIEVA